MHIDGFANFLLIFVQKNIFLTLTIFNQNDFNKLFVKFFSWNVYIRYLICFQVMKNKFHKKLQNCKGGTILIVRSDFCHFASVDDCRR